MDEINALEEVINGGWSLSIRTIKTVNRTILAAITCKREFELANI